MSSSARRRATSARKRGGDVSWVSIEGLLEAERHVAISPTGLEPDRVFDREWAHTVLRRALARLEEEQPDAGRKAFFTACRPFLVQPAEPGDYDPIANRFGMNKGSVAVAVHRLKGRYQELVRAEVAETVARPEDVEAELRHLLQAVSQE